MPPTWFIDVDDGGRIELTTEDLQCQTRFQRRCMECLNTMPPAIKSEQWRSLIQTLLEKITVIDVPKDASMVGQFMNLLEDFCTSRAQAKNKEEIIIGKPWYEDNKHHFRMSDLMAFLDRRKFKDFKVHKIAQVIKQNGGQHSTFNIRNKCVNVWSIPEFSRRDEGPLPLSVFEDIAKI
jgi:hypothetical protein